MNLERTLRFANLGYVIGAFLYYLYARSATSFGFLWGALFLALTQIVVITLMKDWDAKEARERVQAVVSSGKKRRG